MIKGVKMSIGGRDRIVPALSLNQLEEFDDDIKTVSDLKIATTSPHGKKRIDAVCNIVHAALSRNYPELTLEQVREDLDLNTQAPAVQAIFGQTGFKDLQGEEALQSPGEEGSPSTGGPSKQESPSEPDGPSTMSESA